MLIQYPANQKSCFRIDFPSESAAVAFEANKSKLRKWTLLAHSRGFKNMGTSVCGVDRGYGWLVRSAMKLFEVKVKPSRQKGFLFKSEVVQFPVGNNVI